MGHEFELMKDPDNFSAETSSLSISGYMKSKLFFVFLVWCGTTIDLRRFNFPLRVRGWSVANEHRGRDILLDFINGFSMKIPDKWILQMPGGATCFV